MAKLAERIVDLDLEKFFDRVKCLLRLAWDYVTVRLFVAESTEPPYTRCPSTRAFAPRFFQTPPHGDALELRYHFTSIRL
jgi:hypothetical protein